MFVGLKMGKMPIFNVQRSKYSITLVIDE